MGTYSMVISYMSSLTVTTSIEGLGSGAASTALKQSLQKGNRRAAARVQALVRRRNMVPVRTGRLRASFTAIATADGIEMSFSAPYAPFVDEGARPHAIKARSGGKLKFNIGGKTIFTDEVSHPGFVGFFFVDAIRSLASQVLTEEINNAMMEAVI